MEGGNVLWAVSPYREVRQTRLGGVVIEAGEILGWDGKYLGGGGAVGLKERLA